MVKTAFYVIFYHDIKYFKKLWNKTYAIQCVYIYYLYIYLYTFIFVYIYILHIINIY